MFEPQEAFIGRGVQWQRKTDLQPGLPLTGGAREKLRYMLLFFSPPDTCLTAVSEGKIEEFAFKDRLTFLTTELNMHF